MAVSFSLLRDGFRRTSSPPSNGALVSPGTDVASVSTLSRENITPIERSEKTPPTDLEIRLDTARAIDLFTMKPKVRLGLLSVATKTNRMSRVVRHADCRSLHQLWVLAASFADRSTAPSSLRQRRPAMRSSTDVHTYLC